MRDPRPGDVVNRGAFAGPLESGGCIGGENHVRHTERISLFEMRVSCSICTGEWIEKIGRLDKDSKELVFDESSTSVIKRLPRTSPLPPEQNPNRKLAEAILKFVPSSNAEREKIREERQRRAADAELKARLARLRGNQ